MASETKNPHDAESPEWQLWENMRGAELAAAASQADADRSLKKASELRAKADRYRDALAKLAA